MGDLGAVESYRLHLVAGPCPTGPEIVGKQRLVSIAEQRRHSVLLTIAAACREGG